MKKITLVTSRFPNNSIGGFEIKNYQLIKYLSNYFDITLHVIQYSKPSQVDYLAMTKFCNNINIYHPKYLEVFWSMICAFFSGKPLQNSLYHSTEAIRYINQDLIKSDVAICSVIRTANYIFYFKGIKLYDLADSLGQVYKRSVNKTKGLLRLAYMIEAPRMLKLEQRLIDSSQGVFFFNKNEAKIYNNQHNVHVLTHGVNSDLFSIQNFDSSYSNCITIIGKMNVLHNIMMVKWFNEEVMPLLPNDFRLLVIGSNPARQLIDLARNSSRLVIGGFIENPYPAIRSSIACICPLQIGGGIQNKIIESMAVGAITIASSHAAAPLKNISKSGLIVCNQPSEWAEKILEIQSDPAKFDSNRHLNRIYAKEMFSWEAYGGAIADVINQNINREN